MRNRGNDLIENGSMTFPDMIPYEEWANLPSTNRLVRMPDNVQNIGGMMEDNELQTQLERFANAQRLIADMLEIAGYHADTLSEETIIKSFRQTADALEEFFKAQEDKSMKTFSFTAAAGGGAVELPLQNDTEKAHLKGLRDDRTHADDWM